MQRTVDFNAHAEVLRKAFDQVCDTRDWKAPIDALVPLNQVSLYVDAIMFMTATQPKIESTDQYVTGHLAVRLTSIGYRAGPAGG